MTDDSSSPIQTATDAIEAASSSVRTAIEKGREPDMPLGIVSAR